MPNKIFLLGNGFDLAHGLKTSYYDFVQYYKKKIFDTLNQENYYGVEDTFEIQYTDHIQESYENLFSGNYGSSTRFNTYNSRFIMDLISGPYKLWSDIEFYYFQLLKKYANTPKVNTLNRQFELVKEELIDYLKTVEKEKIRIRPEIKSRLNDADLILNFNYTSTINSYLKNFEKKPDVIFIHGELDIPAKPIIFGYGDEHDEDYQKLENLADIEVLRNLKYPQYTKSRSFSNLIKYTDEKSIDTLAPYEIHLIGLSCGLSDRTLLRLLLNSDACEKIFIHYYEGKNRFEEVSINLTRHFTNKIAHPKKVVSFTDIEEEYGSLT